MFAAQKFRSVDKAGLWWAPPEFLRYPPYPLEQFYTIVDEDKGLRREHRNSAYCNRIPNSDKFVYVRRRDFNFDTLPKQPFWHMLDYTTGRPLTQSDMYPSGARSVVYCTVGGRKCVLKITKTSRTSDEGFSECFAGLIASMYCVGPSVLDFWVAKDAVQEDGDDDEESLRVYYLMEKVDMMIALYQSKLTLNAERELANRGENLLQKMVDFVQLDHTDWNPGNIAVYNNERLCILDWERVDVWSPQAGKSLKSSVLSDEDFKMTDKHAKVALAAKHMEAHPAEAHQRSLMPMRKEPYRLIDAKNKTSKVIDNPEDYGFMDVESVL